MYKKFILKLGIALTILLSLYSLFVLFFKMYYMDPEYPMWKEVKDRCLMKSNKVEDIVMLGDSRAKADFKPTILNNISAINLSVGGATPIEGYYTLKRYLLNNPAPRNLIISYTPTHFSDNDGCYFGRTVPFDFFENDEYQRVEALALKFNAEYILKEHKSYIDYKSPMIYGEHFSDGIIHMRWLKNSIFYKYSKKEKGYHWFGVSAKAEQLNAEAKITTFNISKLYDYYFIQLLNITKDKKINVYFYIMPFNKSSFDAVNKNYVRDYENYIAKSAKPYHMKICNKVFSMPNTSFGDPSHLYNGVGKNTLKILDCIDKKTLLE